jgi:hypothetical protein
VTLAETRPFLQPFPQPFLRRSRPKWTKIWVFEGQKRLKVHLQRPTRGSLHHSHPSARSARRDNGKAAPCVRAGNRKIVKTPNLRPFWKWAYATPTQGVTLPFSHTGPSKTPTRSIVPL